MKKIIFLVLLTAIILTVSVSAQDSVPRLGEPTLLQQTLNALPTVPVAGRRLQFVFGGDTWIARVNGKDTLAGTFKTHNTAGGVFLILDQTHIAPPRRIPGVSWISTPGPDIVLQYTEGPPASLRPVSRSELPAELAATVNDTPPASASSSASAPSGETQSEQANGGSIMALFGIGGQFLGMDKEEYMDKFSPTERNRAVADGGTVGVTILFIGKSGFTISAGTDFVFKTGDDGGVNVDPVLGLGYVYKRKHYIGGILNVIPKPYFYDYKEESNGWWRWTSADTFITPTLIAGYDFGGFVLGGQIAYMRGYMSKVNGFKFSLGAGVSIK